MNGNYFTNHYASDDPNPKVQGFIENYKKKHGVVPDAMAVLGYDAANMLFDAIKRAGSADSTKIRDALAETKNFPGVSGDLTLNKDRNAEKRIVVLKIEGGKIQFADAMKP